MNKKLVELVGGGALILDCDGTIAPEVEAAHGECVARVMEKLSHQAGVGFSREFYNKIWEQELGKGIHNFAQQYVESLDEESTSALMDEIGTIDQVERLYELEYVAFSQDPENASYYKLRPGLGDVFKTAAENRIPVGVISNATQVVLEATLKATLGYAGFGNESLNSIFTAVIGVDTVESNEGCFRKPSRTAIYCVRDALEKVVGHPISLANSIGWGDTPTDYKAMKKAGIPRIVACDNTTPPESNVIASPDEDGFLTVGPHHDVRAVPQIFIDNPLAHHFAPGKGSGR